MNLEKITIESSKMPNKEVLSPDAESLEDFSQEIESLSEQAENNSSKEFKIDKEEIDGVKEIEKKYLELEKNKNYYEKNKFCEHFLYDNLEKVGYFSELLKNNEVFQIVLEVMRIFLAKESEKHADYSFISEFDRSGDSWDAYMKELFSSEILNSLESFESKVKDVERNESKKNQELEERIKNNIFYITSEALNTYDFSNCQKIGQWLEKHLQDISYLCSRKVDFNEKTDKISEHTLYNIALHTVDENLVQKVLEVSFNSNPELFDRIREGIFHFNYFNEERKESLAKFILKKNGFDFGENIIKKWKEAKDYLSEDSSSESYCININALLELEKISNGAGKELFSKYGIANFARYDRNMLVHQLEMADQDVPYGVIAFPEADWNGSFFQRGYELKKMADKLKKGNFETRIIEIDSQIDLTRKLYKFNKKYSKGGNKISFLVIGGHGEKDSVILGNSEYQSDSLINQTDGILDDEYQGDQKNLQNNQKDNSRKKIVAEDIKDNNGKGIKRAAKEWFDENASVVFFSCSTGKEGGIAQEVSKKLHFKTFAPDIPACIESIGVNFNKYGKPIFNVKYVAKSSFDEREEEIIPAMKYTKGKKINRY